MAFVDTETSDLINRAFRAFALSGALLDVLLNVWSALPRDVDIVFAPQREELGRDIWERPQPMVSVPGMELEFDGTAKDYAAN